MRRVIGELIPKAYLEYVGREASAAPAAGYMSLHLEEQARFISTALCVEK
jgi:2-oxoglutarate dehydrogenase E1 component